MLNFRNLKQRKVTCPDSTTTHKIKESGLDGSCCFVYCDLQFEFYLGFVFFDIWDFRLAPLDLTYPTGLVRFR